MNSEWWDLRSGSHQVECSLKIIFITPYYDPDLGPSAPMLTMLAEDLALMGHSVMVLAAVPHFPSGKVLQEYRHGLWQWSKQNGVLVCRVRVPNGDRSNLSHRLFTFLVYQVLTSLVGSSQKYDVGLITNPAIETGLPFAILCWLRRKPSVFAVWDLYPEVGEQLGIFHSHAIIQTVKILENFCIRRAHRVQSLSEGFLPNLRLRVAFPEHIVHIPPWIDTDFIQPLPRKNSFSMEQNLDNTFVVLYAGNIGFSQGLENVLIAAKQVMATPNIRFVFVGEGAGRNNLVRLVARLKLTNVLFLPFQPRERLPEILATADLALVSLLSGIGAASLPSKTYSIMASARPILAVTDGGNDLWQLVQRSQSGRCVPTGQPRALADAILELAQTPELIQVMGKNGREYVVAHNSRKVASRSFELLFQEVVNKRNAQSGEKNE